MNRDARVGARLEYRHNSWWQKKAPPSERGRLVAYRHRFRNLLQSILPGFFSSPAVPMIGIWLRSTPMKSTHTSY